MCVCICALWQIDSLFPGTMCVSTFQISSGVDDEISILYIYLI